MSKSEDKLWVLAAIVLVALWTMFTGYAVTIRWSAGNLNQLDSMILEDLDVLVCIMLPNKTRQILFYVVYI